MGTGYYFDIGMGHFLLFCMKWIAPDFVYPPNASDILVLQLDKSHPAQEELPRKFWALGAVALAHHLTTHISMFFVGQLTTDAPMHCC